MRRATFTTALACAAVTVASPAANAQAVVKSMSRGAFVPYGLDAIRLRIVRVELFRFRPDGSGAPRPFAAIPHTETSYAFLTLEMRNDNRISENLPLLQATLALEDGTTIDPAVYGPFVGDATTEAPTSLTIAPRHAVTVRLAVGDVPNDRKVASIVLSPNDATPAYRLMLRGLLL